VNYSFDVFITHWSTARGNGFTLDRNVILFVDRFSIKGGTLNVSILTDGVPISARFPQVSLFLSTTKSFLISGDIFGFAAIDACAIQAHYVHNDALQVSAVATKCGTSVAECCD
jgi:hypothetical protein